MDNLVSTLSFLHFLLLMLSHFRPTLCANYTSICTQTPYPKLCHSLAAATVEETLDEDFSKLHYMSMRASQARAQDVHDHISQMDLTSSNELAKAAWVDCLELYRDTVHLLNRSISSDVAMFHDTQAWLSAAVANQQTCRNGFRDFNLSVDHLDAFPYLNLSKFLSNALAINRARVRVSSPAGLSTNDHFPNWFPSDGRGLMDSPIKADVVVARDGSGDYASILEAIRGMPKGKGNTRRKRYVIYVKRGVYEESVVVKRSMRNVMVVGDGIGETIVTAGNSVGDGYTTFRSATFGVSGDGFIARGVTFRNTAGPAKHQAVALRSSSDFSVFYGCSFEGYQDTLYVHSRRQFYRDCQISGTVDFIFGDAAAVFQDCDIRLRRPMHGQTNTVTAQARKDPNENTGIVLHGSVIAAAADLAQAKGAVRSYLGRPWRPFSRTVVMKCRIDGAIAAAGWIPWDGGNPEGLRTVYYAEYMNSGIGARVEGRVRSPGFHVIRMMSEAERFTVGKFYGGDSWIAAAGVPFKAEV